MQRGLSLVLIMLMHSLIKTKILNIIISRNLCHMTFDKTTYLFVTYLFLKLNGLLLYLTFKRVCRQIQEKKTSFSAHLLIFFVNIQCN